MKLSNGEKLILVMLSEIHEHLGIKNGIDPAFVKSAIDSGNTWSLEWEYSGVFGATETSDEVVSEVGDILSMWSQIELTFKQLTQEEQQKISAETNPFDATFRGFDGNNESEYLSTASFLIEDLNRFSEFKGRSLNSHAPSLNTHRRMLAVYEPMFSASGFSRLTTNQIVELINAQRYSGR